MTSGATSEGTMQSRTMLYLASSQVRVAKRGHCLHSVALRHNVRHSVALHCLALHSPAARHTMPWTHVQAAHLHTWCAALFAEDYRVNINASSAAFLPVLAFEHATKRNKPELKLGDVVCARVASCDPDMDPELSCTNKDGKNTSKDGKSLGYGPLKDGYMFETRSRHIMKLRSRPTPHEIRKLPQALKWETVVGANGRVWVKSTSPQITTALVQVLRLCADLYDEDEVESVIEQYRVALKMS